jgi:ParB family transcriptional regulator, chromosome partitioning protein
VTLSTMGGMSKPQQLQDLPVEAIEPNLSQPRRYFDESTLQALADSLKERGVLQPVLVRPFEDSKYRLVAGERRWRAAKLAGLHTIPALISEYDDLAALEVGLIENMARESLNPVEEARACATLVSELGLTYRQIGARVGSNKSAVANLMRLLQLSEDILVLLEHGELSAAHGRALLMAKDPEVRSRLARAAIEQGWTVQTLKTRAHEGNALKCNSGKSTRTEFQQGAGEGEQDSAHTPAREETAMNIARVWGDALGAEVTVRPLPHRKLRVELLFDSPEGAFALGGQIAETVARGRKRR